MILCRTPYRLSLVGGGVDFPDWYAEHSASVLSVTINKYCWIILRKVPSWFPYNYHIVWSKVELCNLLDEIEHPSVKACLRFMKQSDGVEVLHSGDLPARSGMGSSSSFSVGMLHSLHALNGTMPTKRDLATDAIRVEREILQELVGSQDQIAAAYGGFNQIVFSSNGSFTVVPVSSRNRIAQLEQCLMLFYTGKQRTSSDVQATMDRENGTRHLRLLDTLVAEALELIASDKDITGIGAIINEAWDAKCGLNSATSSDTIESMRRAASEAGSTGSKVLGAGGGGFLLCVVPPDRHHAAIERLGELTHVPFKFEYAGSTIVHYEA